MKKLTLLSVILAVLLSASCVMPEYEPIYYEYEQTLNEEIIDYGNHFRIYRTSYRVEGEHHHWLYRFEILNNYGEIVLSETTHRRWDLGYVNERTLRLHGFAGPQTAWVQFYATDKDEFSQVFLAHHLVIGDLIAHIEWSFYGNHTLIVQHIFDTSLYYRKFALENLSSAAHPDFVIRYMEYFGGSRIAVTYLAGEERVETTVIFDL